jgi:predicted nuclease of predicted toxin-antitoxin system
VRLLLDSCLSGIALRQIEAAGHDVTWAGTWSVDPGDEEILARAHAEGRILVTLDKDFGELAIVRQRPHAGIMRLVGVRVGEQASVCLGALSRFSDELCRGAIVTVEPGRVRVRAAPE